ncbi:MAG: hypothetical protein AB1762_01905 [Gemmatimonadota bacterium]
MAFTVALCALLQGGTPAEVSLGKPERVFAESFAQVRGLRELADGRVLISDRLDKGVVALDFMTNTLRQIGRTGRGPAEYRLPTALRALPGDSTLLIDEGNSRIAIIGPDLQIHRSFTLILPGLDFGSGARAVDRAGRFYTQLPGWMNREPNDSVGVVRFDVRSKRVDTLLKVKGMSWLPPGPRYGMGWVVFAPQDVWSATSDGRIAVVRSGDYHVEWYEPNGRVTRGAAVPFEPVPVTMAERRAYVRNFLENSNVGGRGGDDALTAVPADMMEEPRIQEMAERNTFAATKPAFTDAAPLLGSDGTLWVQRSTKAGAGGQWDVFDATGRRIHRLRLPVGKHLAGLGVRWLYVIAIDDDGLQHLERHPRPW